MGLIWDSHGTFVLPWGTYGSSIVLQWYVFNSPMESHGTFHGPHMGLPLCFCGTPMELPCFFHWTLGLPLGSPMGPLWDFRRDLGWGFHMAGTAITFSWCFLGTTKVFSWQIRGIRWDFHGTSRPECFNGPSMMRPWCPHDDAMGFSCDFHGT